MGHGDYAKSLGSNQDQLMCGSEKFCENVKVKSELLVDIYGCWRCKDHGKSVEEGYKYKVNLDQERKSICAACSTNRGMGTEAQMMLLRSPEADMELKILVFALLCFGLALAKSFLAMILFFHLSKRIYTVCLSSSEV